MRWRLAALAGFLVVHLAVSLFAVVPGYLSVDEGTYHLMVESLADGRAFEIWNGYDELPSPELQVGPIWARGGRLVAAPPEGFTVVALPFYALMGYRGLFLLNALAFAATLALAGWLALRLFGDRVLALDAVLVLALATYLWDYSQAAWPHATATLAVTAALTAAVHALTAESARGRLGWALAAGLAAGLGPSLRLDAGFALPAVLLPFLFARPVRLGEAAAALAGMVPGLVALAAINHHKFDTWNPFSYGKTDGSVSSGIAPFLPLAALGAAAVAAAWIATRERPAAALGRRPGRVAAALALAAAAALLVPPVRELLARLLAGLWQLVVDLRVRDPSIVEPALGRTPGGGMVYIGGLKKSLLQSCPYLTLLVVPAVAAWRERGQGWRLALLALVPAAYVAPYALFAWHGGLSLNLRYWTPILPFTSVLAAWGLAWLRRRGMLPWRAGWIAGLGLAILYAALLQPRVLPEPILGELSLALPEQELLLLDLPLALAAAVLVFAVAALAGGAAARARWVAAGTAASLAMALTWAGLVVFTYDAPLAARQRGRNLAAARAVAPWVEPDSLLFVPYPDPFYALIEKDRLRLATPFRDGFADFRALVEHHHAAGRPVYAAFQPEVWSEVAEAGLLRGWRLEPLYRPAGLIRLHPGGAAGAPEDGGR